jgi:hypothetical protein
MREEQALALIQHYSRELAAPTWLIDITWDPAVALFFASDGGRTDDLGVLTMLVRQEWESLSAGGRNRLGQVRLIDVPNVLRIERQRALFLDTSHPDLVEQYSSHSVWFRQVDGLVFEDQDVAWPVSRERLYPAHDPTLEFLRGIPAADLEVMPVALAPPSDASEPLDARAYLAIAQSWCAAEGVILEPPYADVLASLCMLHARILEHREQLVIEHRNLHRLRIATEQVMAAQEEGRPTDVMDALRLKPVEPVTDAERELVESLIAQARRKPGLGGAVAALPVFVASLLAELPARQAELV